MSVEKVLLLFRFSVKGEGDGDAFAFVRYIEYAAALDEADEAMNCFCLQWALLDFGEEVDDRWRGQDRDLPAPGK